MMGLVLSLVSGCLVRPRLEFFVPILDKEVVVVSACSDVGPTFHLSAVPKKDTLLLQAISGMALVHSQATGLGEHLEKDVGSTIWPVFEDFCGT